MLFARRPDAREIFGVLPFHATAKCLPLDQDGTIHFALSASIFSRTPPLRTRTSKVAGLQEIFAVDLTQKNSLRSTSAAGHWIPASRVGLLPEMRAALKTALQVLRIFDKRCHDEP